MPTTHISAVLPMPNVFQIFDSTKHIIMSRDPFEILNKLSYSGNRYLCLERLMSYLPYLCVPAHSGVQPILLEVKTNVYGL
jgi:hypothetical protein